VSLTSERYRAAFWATSGAFSLALLAACARTLHGAVIPLLILTVRGGVGALYCVPFLWRDGILRTLFSLSQKKWLWLRGFFVFCNLICAYQCYTALPPSQSMALIMTSPLFVIVLSACLLREKLSWVHYLAVLMGYAGVLTIAPIFQGGVFNIAGLCGILAGFFNALISLVSRRLTQDTPAFATLFYGNLVPFLLGGLCLLFAFKAPDTIHQNLGVIALKLGLISALSLLGHFLTLAALKLQKPSFLAPFEYTRLFFGLFLDWLLFGQIFTWQYAVGSALIMISAFYCTKMQKQTLQKA
jgi:drug/metabolite transporter (DMT)-like permease